MKYIKKGQASKKSESFKVKASSNARKNLDRRRFNNSGRFTAARYDLEKHVAMGSQQWKRASEWDDYCRERMAR